MPKILIVDDEADLRKLLTDYFEINRYFVMTARDSREALRKVEQQPDLVLLDINMPEQNGLQLRRGSSITGIGGFLWPKKSSTLSNCCPRIPA